MFWAPNLFGEGPRILDLHYKAHPDCDQVAKFHGDRPRELGELVAKQIKKSRVKHKASRNYKLPLIALPFFQGVSTACYASPVLAIVGMSVRPSVSLSHPGTE